MKIFVHIDLNGTTHKVGTLWCRQKYGKQSASFKYDDEWLRSPHYFNLEPALTGAGSHHTGAEQAIFGSIGDSAPDRWGRILIQRYYAAIGHQQTLFEDSYLLAVNDYARVGALRFSTDEQTFLATDEQRPIPPLVSLPMLLNSSARVIDNNYDTEDLKLLLAPGSSLGGARPKASVVGPNGELYIAKFPSNKDSHNNVLWEAVCLTLARNCGINTVDFKLMNILDKDVLLINRFDRDASQKRIPFLSAMSMLNMTDNQSSDASYLDLSDIISRYSDNPQQDLEELWKRMVFNILISNFDDHLRNHAFLYNNSGWNLSPAYDLTPHPITEKARYLCLSINDDDNRAILELALEVIGYFRLSQEEAAAIIERFKQELSEWRNIATELGLTKIEQDFMQTAFEH